jgi:hypothetical protein
MVFLIMVVGGKIKKLEKRYLTEMSELETKYLSEIETLNKNI